MAKQNTINVVNFGDLSFDKPAEILSRMKEIKASLEEATEDTRVTLQLELNALAKAFSKLLVESFNCSDEETEELLKNKILPGVGFSININNINYSYSKEQVSKPEIDKSYLTSQGVKTLKALAEKMEAEGQVLPPCIDVSTKTIHSFKADKYNGEPFAQVVTSDIINITEKEIKKTK
jgi:hypothetical protein